MNRILAVSFVIGLCAAGLQAQTNATIDALLDPLTDDINALFGSICKDSAPELLQTALAGDIVGAAALDGDFPHGTITVPALGVTFGNGLGNVLNDGERDWKFVTPLPTIIKNGTGNSGQANALYQLSRKMFPYPSIAAGAGFGITHDIEVLCSGTYMPQFLTDTIVKTANSDGLSSLKPQFSSGSFVLKVRKVFFRDSHSLPAMSVALGGVYGSVTTGATINLEDLMGSAIALSDIGTVNLEGPLSIDAKVCGIGLEFAVSKKFAFFIPFARTGIWYRHATVSSNVRFTATVKDSSGATLTTKNIEVSPSSTYDAIAGRIGAGFELRFKPIVFHLSADLDLENPKLDLANTAIEGLTLKTGFRVAF